MTDFSKTKLDAIATQSPNTVLKERSPTRKKLELIQACRGIAALLVVYFHVHQFSQLKLNHTFLGGVFAFGGAGVDFFFVLSGFIIFYAHRFDIGQRQKLKPFVVKRLIRIYPLYWLITLAILPIYFLVPTFGEGYERNFDVILKSLALYPQSHFPILIVGWTLSYEIFFYVLFGLAIALKPRFSKLILLAWLTSVCIFSYFELQNQIVSNPPHWISFIFNFHNLEFVLGCLAAYLVCQERVPFGSVWLILGSILFLGAGFADNYQASHIPDLFAYGVPSMLIVLGAATLDMKGAIAVPAWLSYLGDTSYSTYLIHYPCLSASLMIAIALNLTSWLHPTLLMSGLAIISVIAGCLTYQYVEKPLISLLRQKLVPRSQPSANTR